MSRAGSLPESAVISITDLRHTYHQAHRTVTAIDGVTFDIRRGEFVCLLGPSGCGKSTLLKIIAGLEAATAGTVRVEGALVKAPQTQLGIVFQSPMLLPWRDALGNVMLQSEARRMPKKAASERAAELLRSVGLAGSEQAFPHELSGGMQQRVAICRALLHDPAIILMDEPFGALDALTRDQMNVDLQRMWGSSDKTVMFVTHSITEAVFLADRVIVMSPSPGRVDLDLTIGLARPRRLSIREDSGFIEYAHTIRSALVASGVLREDG